MIYPKNTEKSLSAELFREPTAEYRGAPFWAWNGKLDRETLLREIDEMKIMGMGGFHVHVRTGMDTPYLTKEYLDLVEDCLDKAKREKMLLYLYDEDRWPSGTCGGKVTKDPALALKQLLFTVTPYRKDASFRPAVTDTKLGDRGGLRAENGVLLAVYDVTLNPDGTLAGYSRIAEDSVASARGAVWYAYQETALPSPWFNGSPYLDTLSPDAVKEFLKSTHEVYRARFGKDFGSLIPSIFTDEPQTAEKTRHAFPESRADLFLPWTAGFDADFEKERGYSLLDRLPELFWEKPDGALSRVRWDFHDAVAARFAKAYCGTLGEWCDENGIALGGHLYLEQTLGSQTRTVGEMMRCYPAFRKMPGMDLLRDNREFNTALQCRSVKHQNGGEAMLSELYGVTGRDADFRLNKLQGDWQAALGVTCRVPHLFWMTMKGEAKRDYPASIGSQSPWWKKYSMIEDHFARLNTALTRGEAVVRVAVIHPIESFWLHWGPDSQTAAARAAMDLRFEELTNALLTGFIDFDFISEALLPDQCEKGSNPLRVGIAAYDAVIVPPLDTLRSSTLERLEAFREAGGRLIFLGDAPRYENALPSVRPLALYNKSEVYSFDPSRLPDLLSDLAFADVRVESLTRANPRKWTPGVRPGDLVHQVRRDGDSLWFFLCHALNPVCPDADPEPVLRVTLSGEYSLEEYDTQTGAIRTLGAEYRGGKTVFRRRFYQQDSLLLRLRPGRGETKPEEPEKEPAREGRRAPAVVPVTLEEPNALVLDRAEYALDGGEWQDAEEILRIDNRCRDATGLPRRKKAVKQPYCITPAEPTHSIRMRMRISSETDCKGVRLALEDAADTRIRWNGEDVESRPDGWYVDRCYETVPLPPVRKGENVLEITVPLGERTNLEWFYLLGDFGVAAAGSAVRLTAPVRELAFGDITRQGLAFYTGNLTYHFEIDSKENETVTLSVPRYRGAVVGVAVDGKEAGRIAFSPWRLSLGTLAKGRHRVDLTLFNTRQNGFAQLHHTPGIPFYQDPNSWRSAGSLWTEEYQLKPVGILEAPLIETK